MKTTVVKTRRRYDDNTSESTEQKRTLSEEDIRKRAYEIYLESGESSNDELDNWYYAERELNGYYK
jgi:hypothetical protein